MEADPTRSKRILYVITKANWGGAQKYVYELASAMRERGHEVAVAYGEEGLLAEKLRAAGIPAKTVLGLARDFSLKNEWAALTALISLMRESAPDIVHVNSSKGGLALLAARVARVPRILFTAHGWAFNEDRPWWQRVLMHAAYAITVLLSHKTICVSEAVRRDVSFFPDFLHRFVVVRNGLAAPDFLPREEARENLGLTRLDIRAIGMIAELHPTKRIEDAIRALAELAPSHPELVLVVMGEGRQREWLESYVKHYRLEERVLLKGFVEDAGRYLKAFDLFLMTSRSEALALALVEAGYAGLPVIATRVGGVPEVVTHKRTGLLIPRQNPHALARAIRDLSENAELASRYGEALKESVGARFGKERMISETVAVYGV